MKQSTYYFSHDYNARNDRKMIRLRSKLKMEGVGIYWCLIEMLYEEGGKIHFSEIPFIAEELRVKQGYIDQVITAFDLFDNDGNFFWSESVKRRLDKRLEKSEKAKESASHRWQNANAMRTQTDGNAIKERKGNKRKEKDNKEKDNKPPDGDPPLDKKLILNNPFSEKFLDDWVTWKNYKKTEYRFLFKSIESEQAALNDLVGKAGGSEDTAKKIIHQSMANGWKGLFALKENEQSDSKNGKAKPGAKATNPGIKQAFTQFYNQG